MRKKYWIAIVIVILVIAILIYRKELKSMLDKSIDAAVNYTFSKSLESHLAQLHPKYQNRFRNFCKEVKEVLGWNIIPTSSYRSFAEQANLYKLDARNAKPGYSKHNYGLALDLNLQKGTTYLRKASARDAWVKSGIVELAKKYGFKWGGDIAGYYDPVHFEVAGIDTTALRNLAIQQFGTGNSKIQGNKVLF